VRPLLSALALVVLAVSVLTAAAQAPPASSRDQVGADAVVGTWQIVTVETVRPNGETHTKWLGTRPSGWIMYNSSGHMSVQLMRDPRPVFSVPGYRDASEREKAGAFDGYYAYFGTYEVDVTAGTVTHIVIGSLRPHEVGRKLTRQFKIEGDRLVLTTPLFNEEGEKRFNRLVWERVK
jgi:Lipocalin-like domain